MKDKFRKFYLWLHSSAVEKRYHQCFKGGHVLYFGALAIGAHDFYVLMGAVLLGIMIFGWILHLDGIE